MEIFWRNDQSVIQDGYFEGRMLLFFDDYKIKMARKPGKKQKENLVGCTGEGKSLKGIIGEGS